MIENAQKEDDNMPQKILLVFILFIAPVETLQATSYTDKLFTKNCGSACIGENLNCRPCYNAAVDLSVESPYASKESIHMDHGRLEFDF